MTNQNSKRKHKPKARVNKSRSVTVNINNLVGSVIVTGKPTSASLKKIKAVIFTSLVDAVADAQLKL